MFKESPEKFTKKTLDVGYEVENTTPVVKPMREIPIETLPEVMHEILSSAVPYEAVLARPQTADNDSVWMKISFRLKGVSPAPSVIEIEGTKVDFISKMKQEIAEAIASKNLTSLQDLEYMRAHFQIADASESSKPKEERHRKYSTDRTLVASNI